MKTKNNKKNTNNKIGTSNRLATWTLPGQTTGIPDQIYTRLVYEELVSIAPGGPRANYTFRGNSVYDPNYTGAGHQPGYYDILTQIYGRYRVLSSTIRVEVSNTSAATPVLFAIVPDTDPITFTSFQDAAENPRAIVSKMCPVSTRIPYSLKKQMSTKVQLGLRGSEINDEDYSHTSAANPNNMWYWNTFFTAADQATTFYCSVRFRLVYYVQVYDRYTIVPSLLAMTDVKESRLHKTLSTTASEPETNGKTGEVLTINLTDSVQ